MSQLLNKIRKIRIFPRKKLNFKYGFTLAEVLVATTIFTVVSVLGVSVFVNVIRIQNRIILENQIYEDGRFLMERLSREIRQNNIDYEEYYRESCRDEDIALPGTNCDRVSYGDNIGCYAKQFYNPGWDGLGAKCNDGSPANPSCITDKTSLDINTGQNPYSGSGYNPDEATSVCDENEYPNAAGTLTCDDTSWHQQNQLFLINPEGNQKTFITLQEVNDSPVERAVALLRMDGLDTDRDGVIEDFIDKSASPWVYRCASGYNCSVFEADPAVPSKQIEASLDSTSDIYAGFVPITPLRTNVTSLKFYIAPLEDPRKAFAETDPALAIQQQPHVTILMTLQPAESELTDFAGETPTVTLQATVSSRVYNKIESYLGENTVCP